MKTTYAKEKLVTLALAFLAFTVLIFGTSSVKQLSAASDNLPPENRATTIITIFPSSFTLQSGISTTLTATLTSENLALAGKTITYNAGLGSVNPRSGVTDNLGRAIVTYTTPTTTTEKWDNIWATFAGDNQYQASVGYSIAHVLPENIPQNTPPSAAFTYSPASPTTDNTIQFTDQSTDNDGTIVSWYWNFGDGTTSTLKNQTRKYSNPSTYAVVLTVTDNGGASDAENKLITVNSVMLKVPTSLSISPSSFTIQSGSSTTLTATLKDNANNPLANKTIGWSKTAGSLSATSGTTNSSGQVSVTYTAPTVTTQTSVTVTASFAGDNQYQASTGYSYGAITVENENVKTSTTLSVSPLSFTLSPGGTKTLTATLKGIANNPLANKTISWSKTAGSLSPTSGTTNSYGQVTVTYTAPTVTTYTSVTITASFAGDNQYQSSTGLSQCNVYPSTTTTSTQHVPITINDNSQFDSAHGVTSGSGTASDPYIIENWAINASGANGIYIQNTTSHFIIRNCLVENGTSSGNYTYDGIYLSNVINGKIENNNYSNNDTCIYLYYSPNNNLTNNTCRNNAWGIYLYSSSYDNLIGNTCSNDNPGGYGIFLSESSNNNNLTGNNCSNNNSGISLYSSSNNTLTNNTCSNNGNGIELGDSSNNTLTNNNCSNNFTYDGGYDRGILLEGSDNNTLTGNTCSYDNSGISLYSSSNNTLTNNNCSNNNYENKHYYNGLEQAGYGIFLSGSPGNNLTNNNTLTNNNCSNNTYGIWLEGSSNYNTLTNNTCSNNYYGIYIYIFHTDNNRIYQNNFVNNTNQAYDQCSNFWDSNGKGNYWSDWQSPDANNDGIVDNARSITGGSNKDHYPLVISIRTATALAITPSSFTLQSGNSTTLTSTLKDNASNPLANKTMTWFAGLGNISPGSGTTNSAGQVSVTYTASITINRLDNILATFTGDNQYQASFGYSFGTITAENGNVKTSTALSISSSSFTLYPGENKTFIATLRDENNNALANKTINWGATAGTLSASSSTTNSSGWISVIYTASQVTSQTAVTITAYFMGDNQYQASYTSSYGTILPQSVKQSTSLSIFPSYFTLFPGYSGQVQSIVATLKDANNNPLSNSTVTWSATSGSVNPSSSTTDASGQVSVFYTAPTVTAGTSVTITASFAGDNQYSSSSATSSGIPATQVSESISASTGGTVTVNVFEINVTVNVLVVSPNAIPENMTVTVQQIPPENAGAYVMLSHIFDVGPNGTNFTTPATLTLPYDENKLPAGVSEDNLAIYYLNDSGNWERVGGYVNKATKTVSVLINHLSKYAVMAETAAAPQVGGGVPLAAILAVLGVSAAAAASSAWIYLRRTRGEATSELIEHGLSNMKIQEVDIFRVIKERKEFTVIDLMRETGSSQNVAWRAVQKLIKKGLVQSTKDVKLSAAGRGKPSKVYKYVGD